MIMKGKRIIWGFFCALFLWVHMETTLHASESSTEPTLYAKAAVLMDADSGRVLYGKNAQVPMAMASTTKIITSILELEKLEHGNRIVLCGKYAQGETIHKIRRTVSGEKFAVFPDAGIPQ